jgi:hypothetical protein
MASWEITAPQRLDLDDEVTHLDVLLFGGRLNVVGTDGPPRVEVARAGELKLVVTQESGRLAIRHDRARTWPGPFAPLWWWLRGRHQVDVDVSVAVPYETPAVLRVVAGPVVVSALRGGLTLDCTSGRVTLLGTGGQTRATVVSGSIEALGCTGDLALTTVSGEITIADSAAHQVTAKTTSGSLTADLDNPPHDSRITLTTVSGELTIRIREDSDLSVDLAAMHGRVTSTFPELSVEGRWGRAAHGVLGAGTGKLTAAAMSGNIALLRRPVDPEFGAGVPDVDSGAGPDGFEDS